MMQEFKLLIDEIKEQDRKINQLQREIGSKEARIKLLESITDTDNEIIEDLEQRIKGLEGLLSKYGQVNITNKGNCKYTFKPYSHMTNVNEYKDKITDQGFLNSKGQCYDVVKTSKESRELVLNTK